MTIVDSPPSTPASGGPTSKSSGTDLAATATLFAGGLAIVLMMVGLLVLAFVALFRDGGSADAPVSSELDISLTEFAIEGELTAPAGAVTLNVVNSGAIEHNLQVRELGVTTPNLMSRGVDTLALGDLEPGSYELFCSISGHIISVCQIIQRISHRSYPVNPFPNFILFF